MTPAESTDETEYARVYDEATDDLVAKLHSKTLVSQFQESNVWRVEVVCSECEKPLNGEWIPTETRAHPDCASAKYSTATEHGGENA